MRFFFNPIIFLFELVAFAIQAVVAYGILVTICIALVIYGISTMPKDVEITKSERVCTKIEGCKTFPSAKTEEEYCPTCVWKETSKNSEKSIESKMSVEVVEMELDLEFAKNNIEDPVK